MKIPKSWGLRDHARVRRLIHRCLEERPGRYVPLESTWWGFRMFQILPGFLWYPLIVWLRMNGMPMNQQFLGHLSCRLHVDLVDLMPEITGCTVSACRVPVKCCSVLPWYVGHDQTKAPGSMPGSMPGCTISAESTAALAARMDMTSMGVTNLTHFQKPKASHFDSDHSDLNWRISWVLCTFCWRQAIQIGRTILSIVGRREVGRLVVSTCIHHLVACKVGCMWAAVWTDSVVAATCFRDILIQRTKAPAPLLCLSLPLVFLGIDSQQSLTQDQWNANESPISWASQQMVFTRVHRRM
jgi:hypothetical protein